MTPEQKTSELLTRHGWVHAFFTRRGGVSTGPFATLNAAASSGDDPAHVKENVASMERALGVDAGRLFYPSQVHGTDAVVVGRSANTQAEALEQRADVVIAAPGLSSEAVACGVRSADCGTILIGDRISGVVAAIHAGWKGTAIGVVPAALKTMDPFFGPKRDLVAAVGPHIERCCFEVGEDVAAELAACSSLGDEAVLREQAKPHVDLRAILTAQLQDGGVSEIDHVRGCTVCDADSYFSFRRDGARSGRLMSAIVLRDP